MNEYRTHLVYHIDKGLGVVPTEATDNIMPILTREDSLNQEGELIRIERASNQKPQGCRVEVEKG